jgi:hypothetical protein
MIESCLYNGALYQYRDPVDGTGDLGQDPAAPQILLEGGRDHLPGSIGRL